MVSCVPTPMINFKRSDGTMAYQNHGHWAGQVAPVTHQFLVEYGGFVVSPMAPSLQTSWLVPRRVHQWK